MSTAVVWFRRDLRVHDLPALAEAAVEHDRVVPLFVLDPAILRGRWRSGPRIAFMLGCLRALDAELRARGSGLVVREGPTAEEVPALAREAGADVVLCTDDCTPFGRRRDERVAAAGVTLERRPGLFIVEPAELRTKQDRPYTVYGPYRRAWGRAYRRPVLPAPDALPPLPPGLRTGRLPTLEGLGLTDERTEPGAFPPGEPAARERAAAWVAGPVRDYHERRDQMAGGSSRLSPYLRFGALSALELAEDVAAVGGEGPETFLGELAWRDFYAMVLLHFPDNAKLEMQEKYRGTLFWSSDDELFRAWCEGRTGYPLVDAGMRQLRAEGFVHNRARMVVGSFLTKDLHRDWRDGEAWFMRWLLDGDPASNNGGWQWIASTGTDPAPFFQRMFNPSLQQERFDPDGTYVRRWLPELARVPDARLARPWTMSAQEQEAAGCAIGRDYPAPLVDHATERRRAMERYRAVTGAGGAAPDGPSSTAPATLPPHDGG